MCSCARRSLFQLLLALVGSHLRIAGASLISYSIVLFFGVWIAAACMLALRRAMSSGPSATGGSAGSFTNRLVHEKSPYLRHHAHNPVDWYPWCPEAFERAKREDKPIFLSSGYASCRWCHVMARESFEDETIAKIMNENFVNVKIDREERPDVDRVYMNFLQASTGGGGWPMSVWMTPELKPFFAGTYFPPNDHRHRLGFRRVLANISDAWDRNKEEIRRQADGILDQLREGLAAASTAAASGSSLDAGTAPVSGLLHPDRAADLIHRSINGFGRQYDPEWGGFGSAPKFPRPVIFNFLFRTQPFLTSILRTAMGDQPGGGTEQPSLQPQEPLQQQAQAALCVKRMDEALAQDIDYAQEMALSTLRRMAKGGMHDHVGGGFHRYSVDEFWHVSHFEKMLYDQAQLLISYAEAFQITKDPFFARVCRGIASYVLRDLQHPEGGFYCAEDAESLPTPESCHGEEGAFYIWDASEIRTLLADNVDHQIFCTLFNVQEAGNVRPVSDPMKEFTGKNVLGMVMSLQQAAETVGLSPKTSEPCVDDAVRQDTEVVEAAAMRVQDSVDRSLHLLAQARNKRPRPALDDKILVEWNGLMIGALARAGFILDEPAWIRAAEKAAAFLQRNLVVDGRLMHVFRDGVNPNIRSFLPDYAYLIHGLLETYEVTGNWQWLQWARFLQKEQDALFWDEQAGGYFEHDGRDPTVVLRLKEDYDGAEPSGNSISVCNLVRLAGLLSTEAAEFLSKASSTIRCMEPQLARMSVGVPQLMVGLMMVVLPKEQLVLADDRLSDGKAKAAICRKIAEHFVPFLSVVHADDGEGQKFLAGFNEYLADVRPVAPGKPTVYLCRDCACQLPLTETAELEVALRLAAGKGEQEP